MLFSFVSCSCCSVWRPSSIRAERPVVLRGRVSPPGIRQCNREPRRKNLSLEVPGWPAWGVPPGYGSPPEGVARPALPEVARDPADACSESRFATRVREWEIADDRPHGPPGVAAPWRAPVTRDPDASLRAGSEDRRSVEPETAESRAGHWGGRSGFGDAQLSRGRTPGSSTSHQEPAGDQCRPGQGSSAAGIRSSQRWRRTRSTCSRRRCAP